MKYIVKDQSNNLMTMVVPGNLPQIPGIEILGLASELNPNNIDLERLSWQEVELEPAIEAQPAVLDENEIEISPAIEAKAAVMGMALVEDSAKVLIVRQGKANANLDAIRVLRQPLLTAADHEINTLEDDSQDASSLRAYRKALRECTDSLKKIDGDAKLSCENLVPEQFEFPTKPE